MMRLVLASSISACTHEAGSGKSADREQDIKAAAPATDEHDPKLVGQWSTDGSEPRLFHFLALAKDGTFHAVGGCAPTEDGGTARCFAIVEIHGTWTTSATGPEHPALPQLTLNDQSGRATDLLYTLSGDSVSFSTDVSSPKSVFRREPQPRVGAAEACKKGDLCVDGFECRSNCPNGAECVVQFNLCQPKLVMIKQDGICGPTSIVAAGAQCEHGLVCKSNCPDGAKCIVDIETCQLE
jgi:hypothetical protein